MIGEGGLGADNYYNIEKINTELTQNQKIDGKIFLKNLIIYLFIV